MPVWLIGFIIGAVAMWLWCKLRGVGANANVAHIAQAMMFVDLARYFGEDVAMAFMRECVNYRVEDARGLGEMEE